MSNLQGEMFGGARSSSAALKAKRSGAFTDNMRLPVHRWFRYSAGFSAEWAQAVINQHGRAKGLILDPFVGSGTTLIAAQQAGAAAVGVESHSFVYRVAKAKLNWTEDQQEVVEAAFVLLERARALATGKPTTKSSLLLRCYTHEALTRLEALKASYASLAVTDALREILWLVITSILRECSSVGTAQWQYILPNKTKSRVSDPFTAFLAATKSFCADMAELKFNKSDGDAELAFMDARDLSALGHLKSQVSLVLTSPPYPNNYDYADATRLEMTFWGEVNSWGDLQNSVRHRLIRSCSQHAAAERLELDVLLGDPAIAPIRDELRNVCTELAEVRETKGGRKAYHTMIAAYFIDLAKVWNSLRPLCREDAEACFVIGDSAPYGVYVPVDRWLGTLALAAGFRRFEFEKIRDRNLKWKNRKHRVPLKEGHLRVYA
jgi:hypothetical protein